MFLTRSLAFVHYDVIMTSLLGTAVPMAIYISTCLESTTLSSAKAVRKRVANNFEIVRKDIWKAQKPK